MAVYDKRQMGKGRSEINRKRFLDRYKNHIKKSVDKAVSGRSIKDITEGGEVTVKRKYIDEPSFDYNRKTGEHDIVLPGNTSHSQGDHINKPEESGRGRSAGNSGEGEDDFTFTLSKDEFMDIFFQDMELPYFIKESLKQATKFKYIQNGVVKHGNPSRLHLKKTFENALARKIATKKQSPYLDDMDLRFRLLTAQPKPICKAVMFCLMDVSGSMGEHEKALAKKFFILLYLFLHKTYTHVDIRFIRHTTQAQEVDENTFFYSPETGGTIVSSGLQLIDDLIKNEYDDNTNIYVAQASDGDNWSSDDEACINILEGSLLQAVQFFAYVQIEREDLADLKFEHGFEDLYVLYKSIKHKHNNFQVARIYDEKDVFPVLQDLFKKGQQL